MTTEQAILNAIEYLDLAHGQDNDDVNAIIAQLARIVNTPGLTALVDEKLAEAGQP